ncbi:MAG TPA: GxxExxY protein [Spirochaetia bacterium]|nr:GxxExxY protein [Spirochaetales bacterium]HRY81150.1 GxxExxY protein [Spirochaetia bacterium]HRZ90719.1 GxxExxY protein [Spirochaetia bacterium]
MIKDEVSERIIGCAFQVYNILGSGFLESVYKKALVIELTKAGLTVEEETPITVTYKGQIVGWFNADLIVEKKIILELKAIDVLAKTHEIQLVNYLKATGIPVGLLINFGTTGIQIKRKYKDPVDPDHPGILSKEEESQ